MMLAAKTGGRKVRIPRGRQQRLEAWVLTDRGPGRGVVTQSAGPLCSAGRGTGAGEPDGAVQPAGLCSTCLESDVQVCDRV